MLARFLFVSLLVSVFGSVLFVFSRKHNKVIALASTAVTPTAVETPRPGQSVLPPTKWSLWNEGTKLRGATIWLKRAARPGEFSGQTIGPNYSTEDFRSLKSWGANYVNISYPGIYAEKIEMSVEYELEQSVLRN
jgi:hypothetical protein